MASLTYTPPTSWTDKSMDWTDPDPTCIDYAYALYLACRERAATSWNDFMRQMKIPAQLNGTEIVPPSPGDPLTASFYRNIYTFIIQLVDPGTSTYAYQSGAYYWVRTPLATPQTAEAYAPINPDTFQPVPLAITSADFEASGIALSSTIPDRNETDLTAWKNFLIAAKTCLDLLTCQIVAIRHQSSLYSASGNRIELAQMGEYYENPDATIEGATSAAILTSWGTACDKLAAYRSSYTGHWNEELELTCSYTYDEGDVTKDFTAPSDEEGALYAIVNKFPFSCKIHVRASKTMPAQTDKQDEQTSRFFDFGLGLSDSAWTTLAPASAAPTIYDNVDLIWEDDPQPITPLATLFPGGSVFPPGISVFSANSTVTVPTPPADSVWIVTETDRPEELEEGYFSETSYLYLGFRINAIAADFACSGGFRFYTTANS